jgi:hypothetical protein
MVMTIQVEMMNLTTRLERIQAMHLAIKVVKRSRISRRMVSQIAHPETDDYAGETECPSEPLYTSTHATNVNAWAPAFGTVTALKVRGQTQETNVCVTPATMATSFPKPSRTIAIVRLVKSAMNCLIRSAADANISQQLQRQLQQRLQKQLEPQHQL